MCVERAQCATNQMVHEPGGQVHEHDDEHEELLNSAANEETAEQGGGVQGGTPSLEDLASFFERAGRAALTELRDGARNPEEVARKLRERVRGLTEVHIHRDRKKAAEIETIDYMPQDSEVYRRWLHTQPLQRIWDRWTMMFLVGFVVGITAFCLHVFFHTLAITKVRRSALCAAPSFFSRVVVAPDGHAARHHRLQRGPRLDVQRGVLVRAGGHERRVRAVGGARRGRVWCPRGHGLPQRLLAAQGAWCGDNNIII